MAKIIHPCNFFVQALKPGLEAANKAYRAMYAEEIEVTVPAGPRGKRYIFLVTGVPAEWINTIPWPKEFGVELMDPT